MKSTYKLFGTVWDGIEDNNQLMVADYGQQDATATISLSALLRASSEDDVSKLLEPFRGSDVITIDMDYRFAGENPTIKAFVEKRKRQIRTFILEKFKVVYCCHNTD